MIHLVKPVLYQNRLCKSTGANIFIEVNDSPANPTAIIVVDILPGIHAGEDVNGFQLEFEMQPLRQPDYWRAAEFLYSFYLSSLVPSIFSAALSKVYSGYTDSVLLVPYL